MIVLLLEEANSLKNKKFKVDRKMDGLLASLFSKIFSEGKYPTDKIVNLIEDKHSIRTGPFGSQLHHDEFTESGIPVLGIDNVVKNKFRWVVKRCLPEEKFRKFSRFRVFPGDVLVTIMGTVGRVVVAPDNLPECMSTKHLCVITTNKKILNPVYLWASLLFDRNVRHQTKNVANGAIMEGWNSTIIKNLVISLPPIELQNKFADLVKEIEMQKDKQKESTQKIDELFNAVMAKSFA
jgi:type I restriction enzyme S subunit